MTRTDLLVHAMKGKYAIPAFNYSDNWELLAILEAAEEENAPVITATNMQSIQAQSPEFCSALNGAAEKRFHIPVLNHLDHSKNVDLCKTAINCGYRSVMIDGAVLPLEENIVRSKEVAHYAHARHAVVEAELGKIRGNNEEGNCTGQDYLADPAEGIRFVSETGVDSLAIGIGKAKPELRFDILEKFRKLVDIPLVLHGCTGIPAEDVQRAIKMGISKVNVGTELHYTYLKALKGELEKSKGNNVFENFLPAKEAIKQVVKKWIHVCMADGKAEDFI